MAIKEKETSITNIDGLCAVLSIKEATRLTKEHWELIPVFWNYYLRENKYDEMCEIIHVCNIRDNNYIDDMIELLSAENSQYASSQMGYMCTSIIKIVEYIPEGFKKFLLESCEDMRIMSYIIQYGDDNFVIEAKIKVLRDHPENMEFFINYMNSYCSEDGGYTMNDFYKGLPPEYQLSIIL